MKLSERRVTKVCLKGQKGRMKNASLVREYLLGKKDSQLESIFDRLASFEGAPKRVEIIDLLDRLTHSDSLMQVISAYAGVRAAFPECVLEILGVSEALLKASLLQPRRSANFDVGVIVSCFRMGAPISKSASPIAEDRGYDAVFIPFIVNALTGNYFWGRNSSEWRPTEQMVGEISNAIAEYSSVPIAQAARSESIGLILSGLKKAAEGSEQASHHLGCEPRHTIARQLIYRRYVSLSFVEALYRLVD